MTPSVTQPNQRRHIAVFILASLLVMTSCQKNSLYHQSAVFERQGWDMNDTLRFNDSLGGDAPLILHRTLTLRHTNAYPYQNLWLYINTFTADSLVAADSINWSLAKPDGRWLGSGWGSLYTLTYNLPDLTFLADDSLKHFKVDIVHGLRDSLLTGLSDLGLRLYTD